MSLQYAHDVAASGCWADRNASACPCRGGWFLSDLDTWHKCPEHHVPGSPHPEEASEDTPRPPRPGNDDVPNRDDIAKGERCRKCNGVGGIAEYLHIMGGQCFRCNGSGVDPKPQQKRPRKKAHTQESKMTSNPKSERAQAAYELLYLLGVVDTEDEFTRFFQAAFTNEARKFRKAAEESGYAWMLEGVEEKAQKATETRALRRAGRGVWDELIVDSGKWVGTSSIGQASRGLHDYKRVVKFERDLTWGETRAIEQALHAGYPDRCPGWTGVHGRQGRDNVVTFTTTMDSSG